MKSIAIANHKGGVGKTSTTVNLAAAWAENGHRVLVVDLDPQGTASGCLGVEAPEAGRHLLEVLADAGDAGELVQASSFPGVDVIPSGRWLGRLEATIGADPGGESVLGEMLERLPESWDRVLIDTPPAVGLLAYNGLVAARWCLLTTEPGSAALVGLADAARAVGSIRKRFRREVEILGAVLVRADLRTLVAQETLEELRRGFADRCCQTVIRSDVRVMESPGEGRPLLAYAPRSRAAVDYRELARELEKRL